MIKQLQSHSYLSLACIALAVLLSFSGHVTFGSDAFEVNREFPNLFLQSDVGQDPDDAKLREAEVLVEKALHSIFRRLQVPVFVEGQYKMVNYFDYVQSYVTGIDPKAEVMPSGGVVRSALGYIYSELYDASFEKPKFDPYTELKGIASAKNPIPIYEIRGVGSDFDLLVRGHTAASLSKIKIGVNQVTAGISSSFKVQVGKTDMTRTLFTIEDIKDYQSQTNRSVKQGGADIDFLSFSLAEGKVVEPSSRDGIFERFIKGQYAYLEPERPALLEDPGKQTLRGIRALVELPFLSIEDDSQLRKEITELTRKVSEGDTLSKKALGQIDKIVRNSRYSAGHNRFYRGANGTLESAIEGLLNAINRKYKTTVPEFVDHIPFDIKPQAEVPTDLLIPSDKFHSRYTNNGVIYHGTKEVAHALAILRGGLIVSGGENRQGVAAYGRGGYSTAKYSTSKAYAGSHGIVFTLRLKKDLPVKILDWQKAKDSQFIAGLKRKYPNRDIHEVLARNYGVDVILNNHILIQNTAAIEFPKSITDIVSAVMDSLRSQIEAGEMPGQSALRTALTFSNYARALGVSDGLEFDHGKLLDLAKKSRNTGVILTRPHTLYHPESVNYPAILMASGAGGL